ncbi:MAG: substrate-binding domain-containing protein, partial [Candidatus Thorarchaeota archaeon]|nr:substrate-binding domain-containing protein [Candidatus Thorarchaeota archaeon]
MKYTKSISFIWGTFRASHPTSEEFYMGSVWKQKQGIFVGLVLGILLGAGGLTFISPPPNEGTSETITTAGSSTVYPLSQEWAEYFHLDNPSLTLNPSSGGSGLGQSLISQGLIDVGASSSFPKPEYVDTNPHVSTLPIAADAIGIVVNSAVNGSIFRMDCDMVVAVFQRNVSTWEELESTFGITVEQTGQINVYVRSDASGTTATFGKWLETSEDNTNANGAEYVWRLGHEEALSFPAGINSVDGNPGVTSGVA